MIILAVILEVHPGEADEYSAEERQAPTPDPQLLLGQPGPEGGGYYPPQKSPDVCGCHYICPVQSPVCLMVLLQREHQTRHQLSSHAQSLQAPHDCQERHRPPANGFVTWKASHCERREGHKEDRYLKRAFPPVLVPDPPHQTPPDGTHYERPPENGEGLGEGSVSLLIRGEKDFPDDVPEGAENGEVVPLQDVACHTRDGLHQRRLPRIALNIVLPFAESPFPQ
mmetsp:Transcript_22108/g.44730  ORF Transcript_22108/g.44730 Transcript_22108/m.44730 type:complete len:225 (-) Transcript_22108:335-1009(-)